MSAFDWVMSVFCYVCLGIGTGLTRAAAIRNDKDDEILAVILVWPFYLLVVIPTLAYRGLLNINKIPIRRVFNFLSNGFRGLLGKERKQLNETNPGLPKAKVVNQ